MIARVGFSLSILSLFLLSSCVVKNLATGDDHEIHVFADDSTWATLQSTVRMIFQDTVFTPQPEVWFVVRHEPFDQFEELETRKNRIVIGTLNGSGKVSAFVRQSLDPAVRSMVQEGSEFIINKYDSKARGQLLMFLAGSSVTVLKAAMENKATDMLYYFKSALLKRELAAVEAERRYHKKETEASLLERYNWTMTIQHDYVVAVDSAKSRFFWIRRANPSDMERWIFVHWRDAPDPRILTDELVITMRDSLSRAFYKTVGNDTYVEIAPYYLEIQAVNFLGRFAYETRGNWRFHDKSGGGPFVNYTCYDEKTKRIYMLDGSIFAPRVEKKKLILQVDALLHTFRTGEEISTEEKEELSEAGP